MSNRQGKGSIILKLFIVILVVLLVLVIKIPGDIWSQETNSTKSSRLNMLSIYETQKYYNTLTGQYATNNSELINTVKNDSSLLLRKKIVDHTQSLRNTLEAFLNAPIVANLYAISFNIKNIMDDFDTNERYFKSQEAQVVEKKIYDISQNLKSKLMEFQSGIEYEDYQTVATALDSLWQLRRALTDYSLQSAARRASLIAETISEDISSVDFNTMQNVWTPLSVEITRFLTVVNSIEKLKIKTTIADRVADFQEEISDGFSNIQSMNKNTAYQDAKNKAADLRQVYQDFLADFFITENYAQYNLTETDSLLLYITEENFYTPVSKKPYIITFQDTLGFTVEDPTLLEELKQKTLPEVAAIEDLPILNAFSTYDDDLDSLKIFYWDVRGNYRRNLDIRIKALEIDDELVKLKEGTAFDSYIKLKNFVNIVPMTNSFSELKDQIENSLISIGAFKQIYSDNIFGNLDTSHVHIIDHLNQYNELLSTIRRNTFSFDWFIEKLPISFSQIKSISSASLLTSLDQIETNLQGLYIYASDGEDEPVYGVFSTKITNQGKVYGTTARKSWEDE